jgi:AraC family transcriptional regulator, melibiose operon regulatory protein
LDTSTLEKQLRELSEFEIKYSGSPSHPKHYSHLGESGLTFSEDIPLPTIVPVDNFFKPDQNVVFKTPTLCKIHRTPTFIY